MELKLASKAATRFAFGTWDAMVAVAMTDLNKKGAPPSLSSIH
jgi:predicted nucleic acid-binding protein